MANRTVVALDQKKWARYSLLIDLLAIGALAIVGVALIRDAFALGAASAASGSWSGAVNRLLLDVSLGVAGLAWLAYRVVRQSYRALATPA